MVCDGDRALGGGEVCTHEKHDNEHENTKSPICIDDKLQATDGFWLNCRKEGKTDIGGYCRTLSLVI
jgi:hypothetical protein